MLYQEFDIDSLSDYLDQYINKYIGEDDGEYDVLEECVQSIGRLQCVVAEIKDTIILVE